MRSERNFQNSNFKKLSKYLLAAARRSLRTMLMKSTLMRMSSIATRFSVDSFIRLLKKHSSENWAPSWQNHFVCFDLLPVDDEATFRSRRYHAMQIHRGLPIFWFGRHRSSWFTNGSIKFTGVNDVFLVQRKGRNKHVKNDNRCREHSFPFATCSNENRQPMGNWGGHRQGASRHLIFVEREEEKKMK